MFLRSSRKWTPICAVIILTGHGSEQAAREGIEKGAFDYLTKPCDLESLLDIIHAACTRCVQPEPPDKH